MYYNMDNCERCNKSDDENEELKDYFVHPSDDFSRFYLCDKCERGLWRYIHGEKLEHE